MIVKRTEWIEWWEIARVKEGAGTMLGMDVGSVSAASPLRRIEGLRERDESERGVPLVRRGCSWGCGPDVLDATVLFGDDGSGDGNV